MNDVFCGWNLYDLSTGILFWIMPNWSCFSLLNVVAFNSQVEAKKAVPKDDQNMLNRSSGSIHGSPSSGRTKKIFVGGLASTVTEADFQKYFDQFGTITDVVVMYDQRKEKGRNSHSSTIDNVFVQNDSLGYPRICKDNKTKATSTTGGAIPHDHSLDHFAIVAKIFPKTLFISIPRNSTNEELTKI